MEFYLIFSPNQTGYVIDHFKTTEPLSTFAFGFIISQLQKVANDEPDTLTNPAITVYARKDFHGDLKVFDIIECPIPFKF